MYPLRPGGGRRPPAPQRSSSPSSVPSFLGGPPKPSSYFTFEVSSVSCGRRHVLENRRRNLTAEALFGIDKLNVPRSEIPAVTHVDCSARIQTAHRGNPPYNVLITA